MMHIAHHRDNGAEGRILSADPDPLPERIHIMEVFARERLVDGDHERRIKAIGLIDEAAADYVLLHRFEVTRRHHLPVGGLAVGLRVHRLPLDHHPAVADVAPQRQLPHESRGAHARQFAHPRRHGPVEIAHTLGRHVPDTRHRDLDRERVPCGEAGIDLLQIREAPDRESRADHQQHRQRHLRGHEDRTPPAPRHAAALPARSVAQRIGEIDLRVVRRGQQPEEDARGHRQQHRHREHAPIHRQLGEARDRGRRTRHEHAHPRPREEQPERASRAAQDRALRERELHQVPPPRAERRAHGDLAAPCIGAREDQVRDVRAGEEEQQRHRRGQHEQRAFGTSRDLIRHRERECRVVHVLGIRPLLRELLRERGQLARRAGHGRARLETRHLVQIMAAMVVRAEIDPHRLHDLHRLRALELERELEAARQDPHHQLRPPVHIDIAPHERWIAAEAPLPQVVAEHYDGGAVRHILRLGERPPHCRRHAEHVEQVRRHLRTRDALGPRAAGERHIVVRAPRRHALERFQSPAVQHLPLGEPRLVEIRPLAPHEREAIRLPVRERLEQHRVDDGKDRAIGADAECECEHDDRAEAGTAQERAEGEAHGGSGRDAYLDSGRKPMVVSSAERRTTAVSRGTLEPNELVGHSHGPEIRSHARGGAA